MTHFYYSVIRERTLTMLAVTHDTFFYHKNLIVYEIKPLSYFTVHNI